MNILIIGSGSIGSYAGAFLLKGGSAVTFLDRPDTADVICRQGLMLGIAGTVEVLQPVRCATSLEETLAGGNFDAAIVSTKSYDTAGVADMLRPHSDRMPPVLCLQNGVENETVLAGVLGADKVIAGTVTSSISRPGPGEIIVERQRGIGIESSHPFSSCLAEAFTAGGIRTSLYTSGPGMKWSKMLTNLPANASAAILDMSPAEVFGHPNLFRLEMEMMREALRVMAALGLQVVDLPGVPVRALAIAFRRLPAGIARLVLRRALGAGRGAKMPSFHIDLHSGKGRSEVAWLNGAVVRIGGQVGVPAPVNRLLAGTLQDLAEGRSLIADFAGKPDKILAMAGM